MVKLLKALQRRRERSMIIHVWKIKYKVYPNSVNLSFKLHQRSNAWRAVIKSLPKTRGRLLTTFENSFEIKAARLWNVLPPILTHVDSINSFVCKLDSFISLVPDEPPLPGYPIRNNNSLIEYQFSFDNTIQ